MPIRVLAPTVVDKIAAGEVIERPASVVKELLENSIDSGAKQIAVRCVGAGLDELTVIDDGCGIPSAEGFTAFVRHATSKLVNLEDLDRLHTLGFRGEALASIHAIADVSVLTRHRDDNHGTLLTASFGAPVTQAPASHAQGTTVTVRQLFANVPARRRFLRRPQTEAQHVVSVVSRYALAHPEVSFSLSVDGRETLRTLGGGLSDAIRRVHGPEIADELRPFSHESDGLHVSGYASLPHLHRSSPRFLDTFVNGRLVQDRMLIRAVTEAYRELLPTRRYPVCVLMVEMDPSTVDVNVHPAKAEVRFAEPDRVFATAMRAIRSTVVRANAVPHISLPSASFSGEDTESRQALLHLAPRGVALPPMPEPPDDSVPASATTGALPPLRPLGQIRLTYIVAEGPDGLFLIDQHAAHERVLFDQFIKASRSGQAVGQALLAPLTVELGPNRAQALPELLPRLEEMGFAVEPFGPGAALVRGVPNMLAELPGSVEEALLELIDGLVAGDGARWREHSAVRLICHASIRAGKRMEYPEMQRLLRDLEATDNPRTCPHGRPTMIYLSAQQLEREFRRQ